MFYPMKLILFTVLAFMLIASTSAIPMVRSARTILLLVVAAVSTVAGRLTVRTTFLSFNHILSVNIMHLPDNVEEGTGACGGRSKNTEHVVAIGGANKSTCGKTATVTYKGKSVKVKVVDECPVCGHDNIDLSPSAFEQLAPKRTSSYIQV
ncbi:hypothetical protein FRC12_007396 [Ceratobasidium sp. 428]|nr:hypothetical protein FRC12_007396 [Ceratobasidium sp. 428]